MTPTEPKKRGRPKKVVEAQKEENPDCKPATRGYVKCIARKLGNHTHGNWHMHLGWALLGVITIVWFMLVCRDPAEFRDAVSWPTILMILLIISGYQTFVALISELSKSDESRDLSDIGSIQKYTPPTPVCEKRKECE